MFDAVGKLAIGNSGKFRVAYSTLILVVFFSGFFSVRSMAASIKLRNARSDSRVAQMFPERLGHDARCFQPGSHASHPFHQPILKREFFLCH